MKYFNNIKNFFELKKIFKKLSKKYHPDNIETGNASDFIEMKKEYDELKKTFKNSYMNLYITPTQAYKGCTICLNDDKIIIPPLFNDFSKPIILNNVKIYIKIKPDKDESITWDNNNLIIKKNIDINVFDAILGFQKEILFLGDKYIINIKPYTLLKHKILKLLDKGYPSFEDKNKRNPLYLIFNITYNDISEKDKIKIKKIVSKYGKN